MERIIEACTDIGFSRTKSQVIELVRVMTQKKKDVNVSLVWWTSFRRRHPHIVLRSPESVSHVRAIGTRPDILQRYFDLLERLLLNMICMTNPQLFLIWTRLACH